MRDVPESATRHAVVGVAQLWPKFRSGRGRGVDRRKPWFRSRWVGLSSFEMMFAVNFAGTLSVDASSVRAGTHCAVVLTAVLASQVVPCADLMYLTAAVLQAHRQGEAKVLPRCCFVDVVELFIYKLYATYRRLIARIKAAGRSTSFQRSVLPSRFLGRYKVEGSAASANAA